MELISREELKNKLDQGDEFKLVMVLGGWAYEMAHIPGSVTFDSPEEGLQNLSKDEEIVVYCSNPTCIASIAAYNILVSKGYLNVKRYAGGLKIGKQLVYLWKEHWLSLEDPNLKKVS